MAHVAGLWQPVAVPVGAWVTFTAWVQTWSSDGSISSLIEGDGVYWVKIGVDPSAGSGQAPTGAVDTGEDGEVPGPDVV